MFGKPFSARRSPKRNRARSAVRASDAARESVAALDALPAMWLDLARLNNRLAGAGKAC
jgi:hypothetical protein